MATPNVLTFDAEGRAVDFEVWVDDLQLFLQCNREDGLSLFDLTSGASPAPPATADSTVRSQWATRDAAARLAVCRHLPTTERAHFSQYKSAQTLYDAVVARYSSPATAALSRLMLPYMFPDLAAFPTVADLITHLRTSDTRYRAALPADFCAKNPPPPMYITLYYIVTRLPDSLGLVRDHFLSVCTTTITIDLLEARLLAAETSIVAVGASRGDPRTPVFEGCSPSPLLFSVASAAAADLGGFESVGAASAPSGRRRTDKGKRGKGTGGANWGGGGGGGGTGGGGDGSGSGGRGGGVGGSSGGGGGGGGGGRSGGSGGGGGGGGSRGSRGGGGGGSSGGAGHGSAQRSGPSGGPRQQQQRSRATLSPLQLREWYAARQRGGGTSPCTYVLRTGDRAGEHCGGPHSTQRCFGRLMDAWCHQFPDATKIPHWGELSKAGVAIFDLDYDAILAAMYAVSYSAEGDCYLCVPPDPGIEAAAPGTGEAAALGASASAAPGAGESALSEDVKPDDPFRSSQSSPFLRTTLAALGFAPSTADPSLFLRTDTSLPPFYILVYVDDLVFATTDTAGLAQQSELQKRHTCTDLGELRSYLGLQIIRDRAQRTITLTQSHMVQQVLQRFDFTYSSPHATPLSTRHLLSALPSDESVEPSGPILARYVAPGRHRPEHMAAAKRVLRYLCSTSGLGLVLGGRSPVVLTGHADASWVDDLATQRSSQGYTLSLGFGSVSWRSTLSSFVLSSSYNKAMLALCREHRLEHRTKHIALRYFLARELQQRGQLRLAYVASEANSADIFTKALPPGDHQRFCTMLGLSDHARAASPTVTRLLAFALVAQSESATPLSIGGECALGTDVLEDRQEDLECLAAAVPRFTSMLLAPEGDPDAPEIVTPRSYAKAITGPYSSQWQAAMDAEMASWKSIGTYVDEVPPPGVNIVDGMWIFKMKRPPCSAPAFKARYVARGFSQRQGVDYFQTFSPPPKDDHSSGVAARRCSALRRPVYGLRQVPREWYDTLRTTLMALGFAPSTADPLLFLRTDTSLPPFYVLAYVDDLVFATADIEALTLVKSELQKRHTCTNLGELRSYLGLQITRDIARRTITLTQSHMVHHVLQRFSFQFSSPQPTPLSTSRSL
ncbi:unnamed protein product [Closterium sp. NIES-53]